MMSVAMAKNRRGLSGRRRHVLRSRLRICRLTEMSSGQRGRVVNISTTEQRKLRKFMAMGIMPGVQIVVIQRLPSYVFQVGFTQVTMDFGTANCVEVEIE
jgi:ferrous iron transport protein A